MFPENGVILSLTRWFKKLLWNFFPRCGVSDTTQMPSRLNLRSRSLSPTEFKFNLNILAYSLEPSHTTHPRDHVEPRPLQTSHDGKQLLSDDRRIQRRTIKISNREIDVDVFFWTGISWINSPECKQLNTMGWGVLNVGVSWKNYLLHEHLVHRESFWIWPESDQHTCVFIEFQRPLIQSHPMRLYNPNLSSILRLSIRDVVIDRTNHVDN